MTNQTIPPCPVCGVVPEKHLFFNNAIHPKCKHLLYSREKSKHKYGELYITVERWRIRCTRALGRACRELGIETVEQLKTRLAPDPRVAVLDDAKAEIYHCDECGKLRSKDQGGTIFTVCDSCWDEHYKSIAAQRGEE